MQLRTWLEIRKQIMRGLGSTKLSKKATGCGVMVQSSHIPTGKQVAASKRPRHRSVNTPKPSNNELPVVVRPDAFNAPERGRDRTRRGLHDAGGDFFCDFSAHASRRLWPRLRTGPRHRGSANRICAVSAYTKFVWGPAIQKFVRWGPAIAK